MKKNNLYTLKSLPCDLSLAGSDTVIEWHFSSGKSIILIDTRKLTLALTNGFVLSWWVSSLGFVNTSMSLTKVNI